jgi:hypothetical protein
MGETREESEFLDNPAITSAIFYPRRDYGPAIDSMRIMSVDLPVEANIRVSGEFYFKDKADPNVLYFHGNGELASEYQDIGLAFNNIGANLFVADFRGHAA